MELEDRAEGIVDAAIELAEAGGFEAVRLRDVAARSGVALGTLYRRFRSKEDLLVAALDRETRALERRVTSRPPAGDTELDRVTGLFSLITRNFCRRPKLARACLKATVSCDPSLAQKVAGFHERMERLVVVSLRGKATGDGGEPVSPVERSLAWSLEFVWFSLIIGWSGGLHTQDDVTERMRETAQLMLAGAEALAGAALPVRG
jgi:AcrR family transcriptional regulator